MHHAREVSAGTAAAPDESKIHTGSTVAMDCRKTVPNTTHFRTIAPKVAPKIVPSYSSSSYPPCLSEVAVPGAKPLVVNTQNYTLMKVAGHDGAFSFVALPQVTSPMGGSVIQTTAIPLQENLKLPIPRYQPTCSKKFFIKKTKGAGKPKTEKSNVQVNHGRPSQASPKLNQKTETEKTLMVVEESGSESELFLGSGPELCKVNNTIIPCIKNSLNPTFCTRNPVNLGENPEKKFGSADSGSLVRYESTRVVDPTNSLTVLSPVVFGNPLHLLQPLPKGKLPILPYSKIKKPIALETNVPLPNLGQAGAQTDLCQVHVPSPSVSVINVSTLDSPCQPILTSDLDFFSKQNCNLGRKRGKKRKTYSDMLGYQTKMRLVGNKLIVCKDKCKTVGDSGGKSDVSLKKYRSIMPKPMVEIQSLASLNASNPSFQSNMAEYYLRSRLIGSRLHRWRQGDNSFFTQKSTEKVFYKCHVCDHSFQLKHHLQDHLNSHSNKRPYHCRLCRKTYVHSGSLSTHMKLHHSENRLKKLMCCEFCAKVFGHIRVYFGHLKEVHRVIISTESLYRQPEKRNLTLKAKPEDNFSLHRNKSMTNEDDAITGSTDEIKLQIRCGRCQFVGPTFSDMKFHLLSVHGDESQEMLPEGVLESRQGVQEEVVKQATHHWRLLNERRNEAKGGSSDKMSTGAGGLTEAVFDPDVASFEVSGSAFSPSAEGKDDRSQSVIPSSPIRFHHRNHYNCLLCTQMLETQNELFEHWEKKHNCDNPLTLWTVFNSLAKDEEEIT
ncbi:zinc finger protein 438 [Ranitomeya imitator]|uniref:zinc finger protein 438 n=1 Tax=Ranitomeya imitator TaxID=111125 RepID=UPI0037E8CB66